jgi:hypothetical protein
MPFNPCEICGKTFAYNADKGCLEVRGRFVCDDCWKDRIFVFGSNLAGRHGKGAALDAVAHFGAKYREGVGRTGNAYAIPTKDFSIQRLHLKLIEEYVKKFIEYSSALNTRCFFLTRIGCGLAGYKDAQIAPMFKGIPANVISPEEWRPFL